MPYQVIHILNIYIYFFLHVNFVCVIETGEKTQTFLLKKERRNV